MQIKTLSHTTKEFKQKNLLRNRSSRKCNKSFRFSNLKFDTFYPNENYIVDFLPILYKGLEFKYKDIKNVNIIDNKPISILKGIECFLNNKFNFYKIDFIKNKQTNEKSIHIFKFFEYDDYTLWFIYFENIYKIKHKSPKLYRILTSFISKFCFSNYSYNSLIDNSIDIIETEIFYNKKDNSFLDDFKDVKLEFNYFKKIKKELNNSDLFNIDLFNFYNPRKKIYKDIIKLLKNNLTLNFNLLKQFKISKSDLLEYENAIYFNDLFGVIYNDGIIANNYIIETINTVYNEYGVFPPLERMIINGNGKIISDFSIENEELEKLTDFIQNLNNLTKKI